MRIILAIILVASVSHAALIQRPLKSCGQRNYVEENSLGCTTILDSEVDGDMNTLYGDYNGNITDANISDNALIDCDKLAPNSCGPNTLGPSSVCTSEIGDGCVATIDMADGAITPAKVAAIGSGTGTCLAGAVAITAETTLATANVTTLGGPVLLLGQCSASVILVGPSAKAVTWSWKRDGGLIGPFIQSPLAGPSTGSIQVPVTAPTMIDTPVAGTYTYTLTVQTDGTIQTPALFPGGIVAKELIH